MVFHMLILKYMDYNILCTCVWTIYNYDGVTPLMGVYGVFQLVGVYKTQWKIGGPKHLHFKG